MITAEMFSTCVQRARGRLMFPLSSGTEAFLTHLAQELHIAEHHQAKQETDPVVGFAHVIINTLQDELHQGNYTYELNCIMERMCTELSRYIEGKEGLR